MKAAASTARVDEIVEQLRANGGRMNTARRALVAALVDAGGHVTAEDLATAVRRTHPNMHMATVYRNLEALEDLGVLTHLHLGHTASVYHFADDCHQHLVCQTCGHVVEVPDREFDRLTKRLGGTYGFHLTLHHFALMGICQACADESGQ
jgi:Fur family ferric uptake transcriptional regulator